MNQIFSKIFCLTVDKKTTFNVLVVQLKPLRQIA